MKDTKFYPLLTISIVLLLASFIMLCFLGYNFYTKSQEEKELALLSGKKNSTKVNYSKDSLQKVYSATVAKFQIDNSTDSILLQSDSSSVNLDSKLTDYFKLRNEIALLLKGNASIADLNLAKQKIDELQLKVDELSNRNTDIENENKRLNSLLAQYTANSNNKQTADNINRTPVEKTGGDVIFAASELRLSANNGNNVEVSDADATEKITGSFAVKTNTNLNNAELMVVVLQPDGRVLKNAWESGIFDTNEGKKVYSRKIKFDYSKGETKRLNFTLDTDNAQKGNYIMQLYNKGKLIGKTVKAVS
ncbi:hypothetical protein ACQ33O_02890 [Ferruginibacter sp. SUN002]|uniref:hypothetical protein n=1 Tax=Ferruginibacter sp. SUN002 TaxID=2937789 RepID=UPI003D366197